MSKTINLRTALGNHSDLTTPTSTQEYKLGTVVEWEDTASKAVKKYIYVKSHGALTAYVPYIITNSSTAGSEVITAAPINLAAPGQKVCVPQVAFTSGYYGFVQTEGDATVAIGTETYAVGDFLEVVSAAVVFAVDGTSGSTARSFRSMGVCKAAGSAAANISAYLIGDQAVIAAS